MHLLFLDDSGSIPPANKLTRSHFVLGGLSIPEEYWHKLEKEVFYICEHYKVRGEIKWRFFAQKIGKEDSGNNVTHLSIVDRDEMRKALLISITKYNSIKVFTSITHLPDIYALKYPFTMEPEIIYAMTYKPITESFQYHLHELGAWTVKNHYGIIVCDHRNAEQDKRLRSFHTELLKLNVQKWKSKYPNLIEHLFLSPSQFSLGIQLADLIAGSIFRFFEYGDARWYNLINSSFMKSRDGKTEGWGLIKNPKNKWEEMTLSRERAPEPAT